jgi:hypothetical protein
MSRSPYYDQGAADGSEDTAALSACPPGRAAGQNPSKAWSVMYRRGYDSTFKPEPCKHDQGCKKAKKRGQGQAPQCRPPLAFKPGKLAFKPGKLAFKPGSLAFTPGNRGLAAKMQARAERIKSGQDDD